MALTVRFQVDTSPSTLISIFCVKSPLATAVIMFAIDRTWSIELKHIQLTCIQVIDEPDLNLKKSKQYEEALT